MFRPLMSVCAALALVCGAAGAQTTLTGSAPVTPFIVTPGDPGEDYIVARQTFTESCKISTKMDGIIVVTGTGTREHTVTVWASGRWTDSYTTCVKWINASVTEEQ